MVVTIFKHRMQPGVDKEYGAEVSRLLAIAQKMPGFRSIKGYAADDGEQLIHDLRKHRDDLRTAERGIGHLVRLPPPSVRSPRRASGYWDRLP